MDKQYYSELSWRSLRRSLVRCDHQGLKILSALSRPVEVCPIRGCPSFILSYLSCRILPNGAVLWFFIVCFWRTRKTNQFQVNTENIKNIVLLLSINVYLLNILFTPPTAIADGLGCRVSRHNPEIVLEEFQQQESIVQRRHAATPDDVLLQGCPNKLFFFGADFKW